MPVLDTPPIIAVVVVVVVMLGGATTTRAVLPEKIVAGYHWDPSDGKAIRAVRDGVNVLIWFSIDLGVDGAGRAVVRRGPDPIGVARVARHLREEVSRDVVHLVCVGGWNAAHPDASVAPAQMYQAWKRWNEDVVANADLGFPGFAGVDWDVEGHDDLAAPTNAFTAACLDLIGAFSQLAKRDGYIVSMAPAESYLDATTTAFDLRLTHAYDEWAGVAPPAFTYHGRNVYAYLLSRYGTTTTTTTTLPGRVVATFDFVTVQLYESYTHALYEIGRAGVPPSDFLVAFVRRMADGWDVDFSNVPALQWPSRRVDVPPPRLVIGLANAWADASRTLLVLPDDLRRGYDVLEREGIAPRGFAFWCIKHEGDALPSTGQPLWLAAGLASIVGSSPKDEL